MRLTILLAGVALATPALATGSGYPDHRGKAKGVPVAKLPHIKYGSKPAHPAKPPKLGYQHIPLHWEAPPKGTPVGYLSNVNYGQNSNKNSNQNSNANRNENSNSNSNSNRNWNSARAGARADAAARAGGERQRVGHWRQCLHRKCIDRAFDGHGVQLQHQQRQQLVEPVVERHGGRRHLQPGA
jgi:hypothetical protein